uniref:hypothetical protein n=1 Tax=uncultured Paracoccus sp. TaxID=189685 RepID=UPI002634C6A4
MAKSAADRYQRAGDLVEALAAAFGEAPETLTLTAVYPFRKVSPPTLTAPTLGDSSSNASTHN